MHIYILFIIISAVIAITLYYAANGKSTFLLVLMALIAIAGLIAGVLFPLMATRVLDAPDKTVEEKHDLIGTPMKPTNITPGLRARFLFVEANVEIALTKNFGFCGSIVHDGGRKVTSGRFWRTASRICGSKKKWASQG